MRDLKINEILSEFRRNMKEMLGVKVSKMRVKNLDSINSQKERVKELFLKGKKEEED